jgi:hypothetical protein
MAQITKADKSDAKAVPVEMEFGEIVSSRGSKRDEDMELDIENQDSL